MKEIEKISKKQFIEATAAISSLIDAQEGYLGELDTIVGDGDHGFNMANGFRHIKNSADSFSSLEIGDFCKKVGFELIKTIKGSAGAIFGTFYLGLAEQIKSRDLSDAPLSVADYSAGIRKSVEKIMDRGHSQAGDCTMLDALIPASESLSHSADEGKTVAEAFSAATEAALKGAEATKGMIGKHGRAKYLGEKSIGHMDPGAMSTYFIFKAMSDYFA